MESFFEVNSSQMTTLFLLIMAVFRVYLEVIQFDFKRLPITQALANRYGEEKLTKTHKTGFYLSVGYILLFAPELLLT